MFCSPRVDFWGLRSPALVGSGARGGLGVPGGFGGPGRVWGYLGDAGDRAGTPVSLFREILGGAGGHPKPQGAPNAQGPPELPSPLDLLQAGDTSTWPPPPPSQGDCGRNLGVHGQVGGTPKGTPRNPHWGVGGDPGGGPSVLIPKKRWENPGWLGIGVLGVLGVEERRAGKGRNRGKGGSGGWERRKGRERGAGVAGWNPCWEWGCGGMAAPGNRGSEAPRCSGMELMDGELPFPLPNQSKKAEPSSSWPCRAEAFPRCWAQTDGAALLNTGAQRGTSSSCLWPPEAPRPKFGADKAGRDWQAPCWLCCPTCAHLGAPSARRDLRWQPWAPGGCARNGAGDSLSMGSFQMEKAAVPRQLRGQRKEGLDHGICASPTPWGSRGHSRRDKTRQGQRLERARAGSRSSCSIALLEKALGWFKVLKGVEGREEATPNTAPVSQPPLSVSQKELDGLPAGHPAVSSPSLNHVPEVPRPEQQALSQRLWEEPKRRMKPEVPAPEVLSVCSFSTVRAGPSDSEAGASPEFPESRSGSAALDCDNFPQLLCGSGGWQSLRVTEIPRWEALPWSWLALEWAEVGALCEQWGGQTHLPDVLHALNNGPWGNGSPLAVHGCSQCANTAMGSETGTAWEIVLGVMALAGPAQRLQGWTCMPWNLNSSWEGQQCLNPETWAGTMGMCSCTQAASQGITTKPREHGPDLAGPPGDHLATLACQGLLLICPEALGLWAFLPMGENSPSPPWAMAKTGIPLPKLCTSKDCSQVRAARTDRSGLPHISF
ncbi:hypothetical protein DV515_00017726 [Chloebia gouldiae]|uniref:Uncharacterized protein n=1 Tax=Chloebia gouldiae TaxID=44316 RepID=A0A3L8Q9H7_CHLGU|nr:hypothetical protein DV515_00017726 [Chloebia gouldiae]